MKSKNFTWYKIAQEQLELKISNYLREKGYTNEVINNLREEDILEMENQLKNQGLEVKRENGDLIVPKDSFMKNFSKFDSYINGKKGKWIKNITNFTDPLSPPTDISKQFTGGLPR